MSPKPKYTVMDDALFAYLLAHRSSDDAVLRDLREETGGLEHAVMQIAPDQGTLLRLLVSAIGARQAVEVGTFTGYSAICIARGLAPGGRLLCCDVSAEWTAIARRYWERAGLLDRIDLRLAPAAETLRALSPDPVLDFAFIDADKGGYPVYYEELLRRLRPGGLIAVDNVLWGGAVVRAEVQDDDTNAIRGFNEKVVADDRVDSVMLGVADGLTLVRKRG
jgi:caffeoyl-CoA O-methyltransferase